MVQVQIHVLWSDQFNKLLELLIHASSRWCGLNRAVVRLAPHAAVTAYSFV